MGWPRGSRGLKMGSHANVATPDRTPGEWRRTGSGRSGSPVLQHPHCSRLFADQGGTLRVDQHFAEFSLTSRHALASSVAHAIRAHRIRSPAQQ